MPQGSNLINPDCETFYRTIGIVSLTTNDRKIKEDKILN